MSSPASKPLDNRSSDTGEARGTRLNPRKDPAPGDGSDVYQTISDSVAPVTFSQTPRQADECICATPLDAQSPRRCPSFPRPCRFRNDEGPIHSLIKTMSLFGSVQNGLSIIQTKRFPLRS